MARATGMAEQGKTNRLIPRFSGASDVGLMRQRNEDSFLVFPRHRLAAVADGMGGHRAGDVASALVVATLTDFYATTVGLDRTWPFPYDRDLSEEANALQVAVRLANRRVFARARRGAGESGMGSTVVAASFSPDGRRVVVGHVGDSRCYRIRSGRLTQLTTDHSLVSEMTEIAPWLSPEEIRALPSNCITRALGMGPEVDVDLLSAETEPGDLYLLCSDGLNGMLGDDAILALASEPVDLGRRCAELVAQANDAGGEDNTTVVLIAMASADEPESPSSEGLERGGAIAVLEDVGEWRAGAADDDLGAETADD